MMPSSDIVHYIYIKFQQCGFLNQHDLCLGLLLRPILFFLFMFPIVSSKDERKNLRVKNVFLVIEQLSLITSLRIDISPFD